MMCVNIHNLFGPFTWWPAMPKMNKRNVMPRKRPKDGKKRRRTLRISVKNDKKKITSMRMLYLVYPRSNQRCRRYKLL